uniref:Maleate isomerase n=1 Tax=Candidatus Kentrum sp. LPFa TaxID=2126335 RepID=A0A450WZ89_9GAMM|nr:MAG: maleate isomerase [Candidatus Kentron sp. LPFa]VFK35227.1 MAG: maleate isomerase [Candidatus Kentron sp. LPFa]
MTDTLGWRKRIATLVPGTNTIVEPDFHAMSVPGVTAHTGRIPLQSADISTDEATDRLIRQVRADLLASLDELLAVRPDAVVLGLSLESFFEDTRSEIIRLSDHLAQHGIVFVDAASAVDAAFGVLGKVERVAVLTPYRPQANEMVRRFFTTAFGVDVVALQAVDCPTAHSIAEVSEDRLRHQLMELDKVNPDVIVQSGTNLSMIRLADEAERWLGRPVLAMNAILWWRALRVLGIEDRKPGFGMLLREY